MVPTARATGISAGRFEIRGPRFMLAVGGYFGLLLAVYAVINALGMSGPVLIFAYISPSVSFWVVILFLGRRPAA